MWSCRLAQIQDRINGQVANAEQQAAQLQDRIRGQVMRRASRSNWARFTKQWRKRRGESNIFRTSTRDRASSSRNKRCRKSLDRLGDKKRPSSRLNSRNIARHVGEARRGADAEDPTEAHTKTYDALLKASSSRRRRRRCRRRERAVDQSTTTFARSRRRDFESRGFRSWIRLPPGLCGAQQGGEIEDVAKGSGSQAGAKLNESAEIATATFTTT